jgi:hypothetical protein
VVGRSGNKLLPACLILSIGNILVPIEIVENLKLEVKFSSLGFKFARCLHCNLTPLSKWSLLEYLDNDG